MDPPAELPGVEVLCAEFTRTECAGEQDGSTIMRGWEDLAHFLFFHHVPAFSPPSHLVAQFIQWDTRWKQVEKSVLGRLFVLMYLKCLLGELCWCVSENTLGEKTGNT